MIAKKTVIQDIKLADFPEEIDEQNNIKVYGETSWENQLAVLSHYLHNNDCIESKESKREAVSYTHLDVYKRQASLSTRKCTL